MCNIILNNLKIIYSLKLSTNTCKRNTFGGKITVPICKKRYIFVEKHNFVEEGCHCCVSEDLTDRTSYCTAIVLPGTVESPMSSYTCPADPSTFREVPGCPVDPPEFLGILRDKRALSRDPQTTANAPHGVYGSEGSHNYTNHYSSRRHTDDHFAPRRVATVQHPDVFLRGINPFLE